MTRVAEIPSPLLADPLSSFGGGELGFAAGEADRHTYLKKK